MSDEVKRPEMFPASYVDHLESRLFQADQVLEKMRDAHAKCSAPRKEPWLADVLHAVSVDQAVAGGIALAIFSLFFGIFLVYAGKALVVHATPTSILEKDAEILEKDAEINRKIRDRDADYERTRPNK